MLDDFDHSTSHSTRKLTMSGKSPGSSPSREAQLAWRMRKLQPPPLWTRQWPVGGPTGSVTGESGISSYQSLTHSQELPIISNKPHGFGGYIPTGAVNS